MDNNTVNQSSTICLKYGKYTNAGRQIIKRYFSGIAQHEGNAPVSHFVWTDELEHDEQWLLEYARGNKCRFIVGVEECNGECRISVRDYFNDNLVYAQRATCRTVDNLTQRCAVRFGFDYAAPDDSEFLGNLKNIVLAEVSNNE